MTTFDCNWARSRSGFSTTIGSLSQLVRRCQSRQRDLIPIGLDCDHKCAVWHTYNSFHTTLIESWSLVTDERGGLFCEFAVGLVGTWYLVLELLGFLHFLVGCLKTIAFISMRLFLLRGSYDVLQKCVRWLKTLFFHCIDIACINTYVLFQ